jgi:hypothetical protein
MDLNTNIPTFTSENQVATWGNTFIFYLLDFPTIIYILNTKGLLFNPSILIAFMRNLAVSQALYALLLSVNNTHTVAYNKITIN